MLEADFADKLLQPAFYDYRIYNGFSNILFHPVIGFSFFDISNRLKLHVFFI